MTGAAFRSLVRDYLGVPSTYTRLSDATLDDFAMEGFVELAEAALPDSLRKASTSIVTIAGTGSYDLSALGEIPIRILDINVNGKTLTRLDPSEINQYSESWQSEANGQPTHYLVEYYTSGYPQIRLWPTPSTGAWIIYVRYIGQPAAVAAGTSLNDWPLSMQYSLARRTAARSAMRLSEEMWNSEKCALWWQRWDKDKEEFVKRCNERQAQATLAAQVQVQDRTYQQP